MPKTLKYFILLQISLWGSIVRKRREKEQTAPLPQEHTQELDVNAAELRRQTLGQIRRVCGSKAFRHKPKSRFFCRTPTTSISDAAPHYLTACHYSVPPRLLFRACPPKHFGFRRYYLVGSMLWKISPIDMSPWKVPFFRKYSVSAMTSGLFIMNVWVTGRIRWSVIP